MSIIKGKDGLSLNVQYDYITLRTPNGNYTYNRFGSKASGKLALDNKSFMNIEKYIENKSKNNNILDIMKTLLDKDVLSNLWNGCNDEVKKNDFEINDKVKFNCNLFIKKYPSGGIVVKVSRKNVFVKLIDINEIIGFDFNYIVKC